jgi:hypothetical protein
VGSTVRAGLRTGDDAAVQPRVARPVRTLLRPAGGAERRACRAFRGWPARCPGRPA